MTGNDNCKVIGNDNRKVIGNDNRKVTYNDNRKVAGYENRKEKRLTAHISLNHFCRNQGSLWKGAYPLI